jgi:hypothetical protein
MTCPEKTKSPPLPAGSRGSKVLSLDNYAQTPAGPFSER